MTSIALASFLLCAGAVVAFPSAAAHDCVSGNPANECGPCPAGESHHHRYPHSQHHNGATYCKSEPKPPQQPGLLGIVCKLLDQHVVEINDGRLEQRFVEIRDGRLADVGGPIVEIHGLDALLDRICGLPNPVPGLLGLVCSLVDQDVVEINDGIVDRLPIVVERPPIVEIREPCGR